MTVVEGTGLFAGLLYAPLVSDLQPLRAVTSRYEPLRAVTSRYEPLRAVTSRYGPLRAVTSRYEPLRAVSSSRGVTPTGGGQSRVG